MKNSNQSSQSTTSSSSILLLLALIFSLLPGCGGNERTARKGVVTAGEFVKLLDRSIDDAKAHSDQWREIVEDVKTRLPQDAQDIVRNEVNQLAERTIAKSGVEFRCNVDFLGDRVAEGLRRVKALYQKEEPSQLPPKICQISPSQLDFNEREITRRTITVFGWNMDRIDDRKNRMTLELWSDEKSAAIPIDESYIGRNTHYQITVSSPPDMLCRIRNSKINKIRCLWNGKPMDSGEILVYPWLPKTQESAKAVGVITHIPPHVKGDKEFATKGGPMTVRLQAEVKLEERKQIKVRAYMLAEEVNGDHTKAEGWGPWQVAYTAPAGQVITSFSPSGSTDTGNFEVRDMGELSQSRPNGELVSKFVYVADTDGEEAGSRTLVKLQFNSVNVALEELPPCP